MKQLVVVFFLCLSHAMAQQKMVDPSIKTPAKVMDDFMDQRFGMFIHWGPVTLRGTEISWSRNNEVAQDDYDSLYREFNPVLFNAETWVKTAKDAGMKYLTITSKHHDGFCLWPTAYSSYNIMNTPFKRDVVGELAKACKKYDIKFCIYFTVLDWHDADYPIHNPHKSVVDSSADMNKFVARMKNELKEVVTKYHPYMLWFDGNWESPWKQDYAVDVYSFLKKLDPNVIVNNRLSMSKLQDSMISVRAGDYNTPEQRIGELDMTQPWESCMTIANQWAWKPNDHMKSLKECIQTLAKSSGGNGNLLFNVGPMLDGRIEARQVTRLKEMGAWLNKYGESIYTTRGGPYKPSKEYAATRKGNKIYLHIFEAKQTLALPAIPGRKIEKAYFLKGAAVTYKQDNNGVTIDLPAQLADANDTVIVLELNGTTADIPVI
jgi:alpha-L-fucosidase